MFPTDFSANSLKDDESRLLGSKKRPVALEKGHDDGGYYA